MLFNYNKALQDIDGRYLDIWTCDTVYIQYEYIPHGHVHTGNLDIIENDQLRGIMKMGAKFRETKSCNIKKLIRVVEDSVDKLVKSLRLKNVFL